jgi:hypothetical protein
MPRIRMSGNFRRRQFSLQREIRGKHQHHRRNNPKRQDRVQDRKHPPQRLMIPRRLRAEIPSAVTCNQPGKHRKIPANPRNLQMPPATRTNQVIRMRNNSHRPDFRQAHRTHSNRQSPPPLKHERYRISTPDETLVHQDERWLCSATLLGWHSRNRATATLGAPCADFARGGRPVFRSRESCWPLRAQ